MLRDAHPKHSLNAIHSKQNTIAEITSSHFGSPVSLLFLRRLSLPRHRHVNKRGLHHCWRSPWINRLAFINICPAEKARDVANHTMPSEVSFPYEDPSEAAPLSRPVPRHARSYCGVLLSPSELATVRSNRSRHFSAGCRIACPIPMAHILPDRHLSGCIDCGSTPCRVEYKYISYAQYTATRHFATVSFLSNNSHINELLYPEFDNAHHPLEVSYPNTHASNEPRLN